MIVMGRAEIWAQPGDMRCLSAIDGLMRANQVGRMAVIGSEVQCFFFFSSRRRHTRFDCDWSSDVCSSDLILRDEPHLSPDADAFCKEARRRVQKNIEGDVGSGDRVRVIGYHDLLKEEQYRSEERRVGKECRSRWSPYH